MELDSRAAAKSDRLGAAVGAEFAPGHLSALGAEAIPLLGRRGGQRRAAVMAEFRPVQSWGTAAGTVGLGGFLGEPLGGAGGCPGGGEQLLGHLGPVAAGLRQLFSAE